jgi:hypothetical protein
MISIFQLANWIGETVLGLKELITGASLETDVFAFAG